MDRVPVDYSFRVLFYPIGRRLIYILTLGRINIDSDFDNVRFVISELVAGFGFLILSVAVLSIFAFFNN